MGNILNTYLVFFIKILLSLIYTEYCLKWLLELIFKYFDYKLRFSFTLNAISLRELFFWKI